MLALNVNFQKRLPVRCHLLSWATADL